MSREFYSDRIGEPRKISQSDLATLIWKSVREMRAEGLFASALGVPGQLAAPSRLGEAEFIRALKTSGIHERLVDTYAAPPVTWSINLSVMFDTLEFLYLEAVEGAELGFAPDQHDPRRASFRDRVNPDLALRDPPMEMLVSGQIVEQAPDELRPLLEEPVPDTVPAPLADPLHHAIEQYRRRDANVQDKRAALKQLADVLEPLRGDVKAHLSSQDESDLFQIVNRFAIRHNKADQKRNYDSEVWLDWMFYVYVSTARALLAVIDRSELKERVTQQSLGVPEVPF